MSGTITISDISDVLFQINIPITYDIENYFTTNASNIDITSFTDSSIENILDVAYHKNDFSHLMLYLAYKLLHLKPSLETIILDKIMVLLDIENATFTLIDYIDLAHNILINDIARLTDISGGNLTPTTEEINTIGEIKSLAILDKKGDIYGTILEDKMKSSLNNSQYSDLFLCELNKNLNLDFSNNDFSNVDFSNVNLYNCNLSGCSFVAADFTDASLRFCDLTSVDCREAIFQYADIRDAIVVDIDLSSANLTGLMSLDLSNNFTEGSSNRLPNGYVYDAYFKGVFFDKDNFDFKSEAAANAANHGVSESRISQLNAASSRNNTTVEKNLQTTIKQEILAGSSEFNKRAIRHNLINMLLYKQQTVTKRLFFNRDDLVMPSYFKKPGVKIFGHKDTINLRTDDSLVSHYGFYSPLEDAEYVNIVIKEFQLTITVIRFSTRHEKSRYVIYKYNRGGDTITLQDIHSNIYSKREFFQDGDTCIVNDLDLFFGGVGEGESQGRNPFLFGDPYVYPLYGPPTKLPDCRNIYRLLEGRELFINTYVGPLLDKKKKQMEEWFQNKTGFSARKLGFVTSGYFMRQHWIYCEGHTFFCDFDNQIMRIDAKSRDFFSVRQETKYEEKGVLEGGKHTSFFISCKSKYYGEIEIEIKIYENPQIDNGIAVNMEYGKRHCRGLLIRNYKPSLMKLNDITKKRDPKMLRKLRRKKNKYTVRELIGKREIVL